jgi:thioredoxin-related protein
MKLIKTKIIFAVCLCISLNQTVIAQGLNFKDLKSWKEVKEKATSQNKLIFIDAFATWCLPCREMNLKTFPTKEVGSFMNDKFIALKVQIDQTPNDTEHVKNWYFDAKVIAKLYEITAFPTVLFLTPDGKLLKKEVGLLDPKTLIKEANVAVDVHEGYNKLLALFRAGKMDTSSMRDLVLKAEKLNDRMIIQAASDEYISHIPSDQILMKNNLLFIGGYMGSKSKYFNLFRAEPDSVNKVMGKNYAENIVMAVIYREEIQPFDKLEKIDWKKIEKEVSAKYGELGMERILGSMVAYYNSEKDWVNYQIYYKKYFDLALEKGRSILHINNMSWPVFQHVTDSAALKTAIKAMDFSIKNFEPYNANAIDTYANLLYKAWILYGIGEKETALQWSNLAAKLSNYDEAFKLTMEKMKRGEPTWKE